MQVKLSFLGFHSATNFPQFRFGAFVEMALKDKNLAPSILRSILTELYTLICKKRVKQSHTIQIWSSKKRQGNGKEWNEGRDITFETAQINILFSLIPLFDFIKMLVSYQLHYYKYRLNQRKTRHAFSVYFPRCKNPKEQICRLQQRNNILS